MSRSVPNKLPGGVAEGELPKGGPCRSLAYVVNSLKLPSQKLCIALT